MRFCPFCAKENSDEVDHCAHCGKKLPLRRRTISGQGSPGAIKAQPTPSVTPAAPVEVVDDGATIRMPMFDSAELDEPPPPVETPTDPGAAPSVIVAPESEHESALADPTPLPAPPDQTVPVPVPVPVDRATSGLAVSASQLVGEEIAQPIDLAALPPMPARPASPGLLGAVSYLYPVARAWLARRSAQSRVERALVGDQQALDQVLGELGRAAREEDVDVPSLRDEMGLTRQAEERRAQAEREAGQVTDRRRAEQEKFARQESACNDAVAEQEEAVRATDEALRKQADQRRAEQAQDARLDGELRALHKQPAPAEEPAAQAHQERVANLTADKGAAEARVAALDGPIGELTQKLTEARAELANRKRALAATVAERQQASEAADARLKHLAAQREQAGAEILRRHVTLGTLLNLNRVERSRFSPLYGRIDDLKGGLTEREALIARLESERRAFDHAALHKGLLAVGAAVGGAVILAVLLILVLS